jgi:hypothetical protein
MFRHGLDVGFRTVSAAASTVPSGWSMSQGLAS